jgi:carboxyl-terminal processing protease
MWQERQEMEQIRKEAKAAGLLPEGDEDGAAPSEEKKLDQLAATDPYVQLALHLLQDSVPMSISGPKGP